MTSLKPTKQQQDVLDLIQDFFTKRFSGDTSTVSAIFLSAVAGAGKTSTIMMIADILAQLERTYGITIDWTALSFNTAIRDASNKKLSASGLRPVAKTTNQLGRSILDQSGQCRRPGKLNKFKYDDIIAKYCQRYARLIPDLPYRDPRRESERNLITKIKKLVSAARLTYCDAANEDDLLAIVDHYDTGIDPLSPYWTFIWKAVAPCIANGIDLYNASGEHDFDDQLFLPLALDVTAPIYDAIAVDEAQDLNKVRTELVKRSVKPNGMLFFVGDVRQAIQGFAFADTESVANIIRDTNAVEMPLTCCWRCMNSNVIRLAQVINPEIEARSDATPDQGRIDVVGMNYLDRIESGYYSPSNTAMNKDADMVLCRVTAPLVEGCLKAIRNGKLAIVRGKSIGENIIRLLDKILAKHGEAYDITKLVDASRDYFYAEVDRLMKSGKKDADEEIDKLNDQVDTVEALVSGYLLTEPSDLNIDALKEFISSKFEGEDVTDEQREGPRPVVFSTIHKAKGLETDTVYILKPELMPHPMALKHGKDWQIEQEYNILYVAVTRAKHNLYFVGGVPASLESTVKQIQEEQDGIVEEEKPSFLQAMFDDANADMLDIIPENILEAPASDETIITTSLEPMPSLDVPSDTTKKRGGRPKGAKNKNQRNPKEHLHVLIDEDVYRQAKETDENLGEIIETLLQQWLAERGKDSNPFESETTEDYALSH